jgi:hypothetical protein
VQQSIKRAAISDDQNVLELGECLQVEGLQAHFKTVEAERDALHVQLLQAFHARNALAEKEAEVAAAAREHARLQAHLDIATEMIGEQNARVRFWLHFSPRRCSDQHVSVVSCLSTCQCYRIICC